MERANWGTLQSFYEDRHLETETCDYIDNDETHG